MKRVSTVFLVIVWIGLLTIHPASAQSTGGLQVVVLDEDERPMQGVALTLVSDALRSAAAQTTNDTGRASFVKLPPGEYELDVASPGYRTVRVMGIPILAGRVAHETVRMDREEFEECVVGHSGTTLSEGVRKQTLQQIPAGKGSPDLVAGVQPGAEGDPDAPPPPRSQPAPAAPTCDPDQPERWWVSPDDSNSMVAPALLRAVGRDASHLAARRWEFFNYAQWSYPPAKDGRLGIEAELAADASGDAYTLQVAVTAPRVRSAERAPMTLTFVLDTSGSMFGRPLTLTRQVLREVSGQLRRGDIVSLVTWGDQQTVLLSGHAVEGPRDPVFDEAIGRLESHGRTDLHAGLQAGYRLARQHARPGRVDRVFLVSDGHVNVGVTDEEMIGAAAGGEGAEGIHLVGVGIGNSYNDRLMERVTDLGRGASVYIHDAAESERIFGQRFLETVDVAARDVKIRYDLPPGLKVERDSFSGEEISTVESEVRPQHIAPNDAMVLHQRLVACAPLDPESLLGVTVEYRDAITFEPRSATRVWPVGKMLGAPTPELDKGIALVALTRALATPSRAARRDAAEALAVVKRNDPEDHDLDWMTDLLER